ncbi:MAG: 16S rRNA (uracil(1498)-N(3))-methyltransferase [Cyclobacteriaceae bacterium]
MAIFYEKGISQGIRFLSKEESRHCSQVLRHSSGDEIMLLDGVGGKHRAILSEVSKKTCSFEVVESTIEPSRSFSIHLAIAPTKNTDRMEWMVEKLSEIGVDELTFLKTQHSERKNIRLDRLEKKAISAMKQSGSPFKLKINEVVDIKRFVDSDKADQKFIAHVNPEHSYLSSQLNISKHVSLLIGPEGDFSNEELQSATGRGFEPVSLGKNTLRTETAGFVACCMVNFINNF